MAHLSKDNLYSILLFTQIYIYIYIYIYTIQYRLL